MMRRNLTRTTVTRRTGGRTNTRVTLAALGCVAILLTACGGQDGAMSSAAEPAHKVVDTRLGKVLATNRGMTLYTFAMPASRSTVGTTTGSRATRRATARPTAPGRSRGPKCRTRGARSKDWRFKI